MAKHRRRKKFRPYLGGRIDKQLGLGTLAPRVLISENVTDVLTEQAWLSSVRLVWSLKDFAIASERGPIMVGVAHSDYTSAEIEAFIELATSWNRGDLVSNEISRRKVRIVGVFHNPEANLAVALNDGKPMTTKCNWQLFTGQTVKIWALNQGNAALASGSEVVAVGKANLWPN